ncbi:MAG: hypothetical protein IIX48_01695 [Lachnospiraceae bacterium]|nr:hypothetical protein [Lachnospiraceae bacterium]
MKYFIKNLVFASMFTILFLILLIHAQDTKYYAFTGLNIWYQHMLPALLPFMILSGLMIDLKLDGYIIKPFKLVIRPLFQISDAGIYTLFMGFLCGFPMGAKIAAMEYKEGNISQKEAEYLLCFCNNFGPAYFFSFICNNIYSQKLMLSGLFVLYGLPLLYGLFLRHSIYKNEDFCSQNDIRNNKKSKMGISIKDLITYTNSNIIKSLSQIGLLGGYMILCNMLMSAVTVFINHLSFLITPDSTKRLETFFYCVLEISGGILSLKSLNLSETFSFITAHAALAFNGLSCHLQTFHLISDCPFSRKKYMLHKMILCSITCILLFIFIKNN